MGSLRAKGVFLKASFFFILAGFVSISALWLHTLKRDISPRDAFAEKEEFYTSSEEFLPLGAELEEEPVELDTSFLKDETLIRNATVAGIKLLRDEDALLFLLKSTNPAQIEGKELKYEILPVNFPPRIILRLYGVKSEERVFRFFKNLKVVGILSNPFQDNYSSEYVVFFADWMDVSARYSGTEKALRIDYRFVQPPYKKGYGVRIADTKLDPLPHVVEIHRGLARKRLQSYLLIASDHETVVLESPFYKTKEEAVSFMDALEGFGYKGKLAVRDYLEFPKPHRFEVVSEAVVAGEEYANLRDIVYRELLPEKIYLLNYDELHRITREIFTPRVQNDVELSSEYYYRMSEIYRNYNAQTEKERRMAFIVSLKMLEIIYFRYPESSRADDALWELANTIREVKLKDVLSEEDCYRKIISEYPGSVFYQDSKLRLDTIEGGVKSATPQVIPPKKGQK